MKVFLGIPTKNGLKPIIMEQVNKDDFSHISLDSSLGLDVARNNLVKKFLATDDDWLLFMDDDVVPDAKNLMSLFDIPNARIVAPFTNSYQDGMVISVYQWTDDGREMLNPMPYELYMELLTQSKLMGKRPIFHRADVVGNCYAVKREVFEQVKDEDGEWYKMGWRSKDGVFHRGEDTYFFRRCREKGISISVAFDVHLGHMKSIDMRHIWAAQHGKELTI